MSSRFKGIFDTTKETENKVVAKTQTNSIPKNEKVERKLATISKPVPIVQTRKKGTGKSSNPDYTQALAYVRKDTLQNVREKLFFDPSQDFSDLIESLLTEWIKKQT